MEKRGIVDENTPDLSQVSGVTGQHLRKQAADKQADTHLSTRAAAAVKTACSYGKGGCSQLPSRCAGTSITATDHE